MKWDVKHDRAKRVINAFLENAGYWQEREDLSAGLTEEEKTLVSEEVTLMITSIRKRYKLEERLPEQAAQIRLKETEMVISTKKTEETLPEPVSGNKGSEKSKRARKVSTDEKKVTSRRKKKETQNEEQA